jgi:hypothetical protein
MFIIIIACGLLGLFLVSYFGQKEDISTKDLPGNVYISDGYEGLAE